MNGKSLLDFLRQEEGAVDRQRALSIAALVSSSVLAQLLFVGVAQSGHCPNITDCLFAGTCDDVAGCHMIMCDFGGPGACVHE